MLHTPRQILPVLLALGLSGPACGKKGDPQPPLRRFPQPATGFAVAQRGEQVVVSLTTPHSYSDGSRLPVLEVELLRADQAGDFAKQAKTRRLHAAPGERLVEGEPLPAPGTPLRYAARVLAKGKASALSGVAALTVQAPPPAPSELTVRRTAAGLTLDWSAPPVPEMRLPASPPPPAPTAPAPASPATRPSPTSTPAIASPGPPPSPEAAPATPLPSERTSPTPDTPPSSAPSGPTPSPSASASPAAPSSGFWVYRRGVTARYAEPLSSTPLAAPPFEDGETAAETVCYVVRTVMATDPLIESVDSNEVCVPPEMPAPSQGAER